MIDQVENSRSDELRPFVTPEGQPRITRVKDFYSQLVFILALILAIGAVIASSVAFAGFAENDTGFGHLVSAFLLCFGIGGLAYIPLSLIAFYGRRAMHTPLPKFRAIVVLLLTLPWFPLGFFLFRAAPSLRIATIIGVLAALFITIWALRFLRRD